MNTKQVDKEIFDLFRQAEALALVHIEKLARAVMKRNPRCKRFCMGMGTASFYDKDGEPIWDDTPYLRPFYRFLDEWDTHYRLTGTPMRIVGHDGVKQTDW